MSNNATHEIKKTVRKSNIELLRIICMILIVAHHSIVHGGILNIDNCFNKYVALFLLPGGKMMFVTFIVISTWFLVDKEFNLERFIRTWLQVLFYSILFAIIANFMGARLDWHNWISVCFPIIGNSHGFAATYLAFYLLTPFLAILDKNMSKKQHACIVAILIYYEVASIFFKSIFRYDVVILSSELTLFVSIYFLTGYIKKYTELYNKNFWGTLAVIIWFAIFGLVIANEFWGDIEIIKILMCLATNETSLLYLVGGYCVFFSFYNVKIKYNLVINKIASASFSVLLFHDHNFFRYILWGDLLNAPKYYTSQYFILWVVFSTISIYCIGMVLDVLEKKVFTCVPVEKELKCLINRFI